MDNITHYVDMFVILSEEYTGNACNLRYFFKKKSKDAHLCV